MKNLQGETIHIEKPTDADTQVLEVCEIIGISPIPYKMKKTWGYKFQSKKNKTLKNKGLYIHLTAMWVKIHEGHFPYSLSQESAIIC